MESTYALTEHNIVLDNSEKRYILKVRDMPSTDRPRERLMRDGLDTLSSAELVAIILGTGTKKEDVLAMSTRIMKEYGQNSITTQRDPKKMSADLGIPLTKALQIVACMELGRRFHANTTGRMPTIRTAKDVFRFTRDMHDLPKEHLRGIYLNVHQRVIHTETISIGTLDANIIHPREVFRPALDHGAAAVILVHNHPSGVITPSRADIAVTTQLIDAGKLLGIDLIDHVVVTPQGYKSIPASYQ